MTMMVVKMVKLKTRLPDLFHAAAPALPAFEDGTSARVEFYARAFFLGRELRILQDNSFY